MTGATTSRIAFHLGSPQVMKSFVCDSKDVERLTAEEAEAVYQKGLETLRAGYIPVLIQIANQANTAFTAYRGSTGVMRVQPVVSISKTKTTLTTFCVKLGRP